MSNVLREIDSEMALAGWIQNIMPESALYIAGAGSYGKLIGEYFQRRGIPWDGYLDKDTSKTHLLGKSVKPYTKIEKNAYVIISSNTLCSVIYKEIHMCGIPDSNICVILSKEYMLLHSIDDRILNFKNRYKGARCFIIGNGPSLALSDLDKIKGEYSFGCNGIFGVFSETDWRPDFYCTLDDNIIEHLYTALHGKVINWACDKFSLHNEICNYDVNHDFITCNSIDDLETDTGLPGFSDDCSKYVYTVGTVTYYMLQLAIYMGFKEIVLLGLDFNFSVEIHDDGTVIERGVQYHMSLIENVLPSNDSELTKRRREISGHKHVAYVDKQYAGFKAAKKYADSHDIKILNASRYTRLDVFPIINLDEYLCQ